MTREEFWMEVYMTSFKAHSYAQQTAEDANAALAAYDKALKEYGKPPSWVCSRDALALDWEVVP